MKKKFKRKGKFYVYIAECADKTYYTGYTPDLERRIGLHNNGKGAKYTRDRKPIKLVWRKQYRYYKRAWQAERKIKQLSHRQKQELVEMYEKSR